MLVFVAFRIVDRLTPIGGPRPRHWIFQWRDTGRGVEEAMGRVAGNCHVSLWLVIVWTAAAFGEEMFFRGYLISRYRTVFSRLTVCLLILAVILARDLFLAMGILIIRLARRHPDVGNSIGVQEHHVLAAENGIFGRHASVCTAIIDTLTFTALYLEWENNIHGFAARMKRILKVQG